MRNLTLAVLVLASTTLSGHQTEDAFGYEAPRFSSGKTPEQPPLASAGGLTVLELDIAPSGIVTDAVVLDEATPYTDIIRKATVLWRYRPAKIDGRAVSSKALVIGVFRPPVLMGSALPEPTSVHEPTDAVPYPTTMLVPEYPPTALYEGVAVVEVAIDANGEVHEAKLLSPEEGYDDAALEAATGFRFRAARRDGRPVESYAIIFFGFRQPVTGPSLPRR